jgi:ferredoxin
VEVSIIAEECIGCGACVPLCSAGAITFDDDEMKAVVDRDACVACEDCIPICAVEAIVADAVEGGEQVAQPAPARPTPTAARPRNGTPIPEYTLPGGPGLPGDGPSPDDEQFELGSWRPGSGKLRRAFGRRLKRRLGR